MGTQHSINENDEQGAISYPHKKERITIRIDADIIQHFKQMVKNGGNYQTLINEELKKIVSRDRGYGSEEISEERMKQIAIQTVKDVGGEISEERMKQIAIQTVKEEFGPTIEIFNTLKGLLQKKA